MSSRRAPEDRIAPSTTDAIPRHVPIATLETLFDRTPDTVFFVKDRDGRYVAVNQTLVERCGARSKGDLVGRTAEDVFGPFGRDFREQDRQVLERGVEVRDRLELHLYRGRHPGWCMTHKVPLHDAPDAGADGIVGLIGLSRDLQPPDERVDSIFGRLADGLARLQEQLDEPWQVADLAEDMGVSRPRLSRCTQRIFGLSPRQLLSKIRLDHATRLLSEQPTATVSEIAHACGYSDHSAFTRHFKSIVGLTPSAFRRLDR